MREQTRLVNVATLAIAMLVGTTGTARYVGSTVTGAADTTANGAQTLPYATIDYAVGKCTADVGDVIFVMAGHVETVAAAGGLAFDVAGISVIGIGNGGLRPKINFTATASTCTMSAANVVYKNLLFTGGIDAIVTPIVISAADISLIDIETRDVTGQAVDFITTTAGANRLLIDGWVHNGATAAGADTAISIVGGDGIVIRNFRIFGNFAVAAIENVTTACTNIAIYGSGSIPSFIQNSLDNAAVVAVTLVSTTTGFVGPNINVRIGLDSTSNTTNITEAFVGAAAQFMQPINICNLGGESSMQTNITASTDA